MRRGDRVFSTQERKTALWALLIAAVIAALGTFAGPLMRPSLGAGGAEAYVAAPTPGMIEATPLA